jgi:hypothetical protein
MKVAHTKRGNPKGAAATSTGRVSTGDVPSSSIGFFCAGSRVDAGVAAIVAADEEFEIDILLAVGGGVVWARAAGANRIRQCAI